VSCTGRSSELHGKTLTRFLPCSTRNLFAGSLRPAAGQRARI
jgi:hypothetical protein